MKMTPDEQRKMYCDSCDYARRDHVIYQRTDAGDFVEFKQCSVNIKGNQVPSNNAAKRYIRENKLRSFNME